jgi:hypothetical protein
MENSQMTPQEIFDTSVNHLRAQGKQAFIEVPIKSLNGIRIEKRCCYRTPEGLKCAIGVFIQDEEYRTWMELQTIGYLSWASRLPPRLQNLFKDNLTLLRELQLIHDYHDPSTWEEKWKNLAGIHGLVYEPLVVQE